MSASLIGRLGSSAFRLSTSQYRCRSRARASLRNRHQGPSIMGFEDEVEQSLGRPCRLSDGRSKRTYELTSSIVPQETSYALQSCTLVASVLSEFFNASGRKAASAFKACSECNRSRPGRNGAGGNGA